jgi:hypothetical protein
VTQLPLIPPRVRTPSGVGYLVKRLDERMGIVRFDGAWRLRSTAGCTLIVDLAADGVEVLS